MGRKGKETSTELRKLIIKLHNETKTLGEISKLVGGAKLTVQSIIDRFGEKNTVQNMPRSGRPRLLTTRTGRHMVRLIQKTPKLSAPKVVEELRNDGVQVSESTVRRVFNVAGYHGRVARKKFFVSETNRKKRLTFAKQYVDKGPEFWKKVIFSDESKFNVFGSDGRQMVWRKKNTQLHPKSLLPTVKHGGGSVLVWGCMSAAGVGKLHIIDSIMDHRMYIDILKENLKSNATEMSLESDFIFQQDNDPKHTVHNTKMWLLYNAPKQLPTPPQSPDTNPIEHLWSILDARVRKRHISNRNELKIALQEEWASIPAEITKTLVDSMPRRMKAIIQGNGNPTKY